MNDKHAQAVEQFGFTIEDSRVQLRDSEGYPTRIVPGYLVRTKKGRRLSHMTIGEFTSAFHEELEAIA